MTKEFFRFPSFDYYRHHSDPLSEKHARLIEMIFGIPHSFASIFSANSFRKGNDLDIG
ncbi:hypothetical protein GYA19_00970 [Candidatus Beckwithbacteria bacterium]|nr:hypothetical protein [Candidatus Beckwithbacteria bacterium]